MPTTFVGHLTAAISFKETAKPPPRWQIHPEDLLVFKSFLVSWVISTAHSKHDFVSLCSPGKHLRHSCSETLMFSAPHDGLFNEAHLKTLDCLKKHLVWELVLPRLTCQHLMFSCLSVTVPCCLLLCPLTMKKALNLWTWCNEFLLFREAFSCNHSWSKWFISAALLGVLSMTEEWKIQSSARNRK